MKSSPSKRTPNLQLHMERLPLKNKQNSNNKKPLRASGVTPMHHMGQNGGVFLEAKLAEAGAPSGH